MLTQLHPRCMQAGRHFETTSQQSRPTPPAPHSKMWTRSAGVSIAILASLMVLHPQLAAGVDAPHGAYLGCFDARGISMPYQVGKRNRIWCFPLMMTPSNMPDSGTECISSLTHHPAYCPMTLYVHRRLPWVRSYETPRIRNIVHLNSHINHTWSSTCR